MIVRVQKYLGDCKWSEPFDLEIDESKIIQVNNDGCGSYRFYSKRGRPRDISYHPAKRDWQDYAKTDLWKKGMLFFDYESNASKKVYEWAASHGIFTIEQPHARVETARSTTDLPINNYEHIARDCTVTVNLTAAETIVLLQAYDNGVSSIKADNAWLLDAVISKLKDQIHP